MYDDNLENKEVEESGTPAWMLTFADLVSLLICFFVLLYSMKSVDETIWKKISGSFAGALNYSQKFKQVDPNSDSSTEAEQILNSDSMAYIQSVLISKFDKEGLAEIVEFSKDVDTDALHVTIPGDLMFLEDSSEITQTGEKIITFITETIQYLDDEIEIASSTAFNPQGLAMQESMLRSLAIRDFIQRKGNKKSIKVIGFGSAKYDLMKDILDQKELRRKTVKLDFIIKSK